MESTLSKFGISGHPYEEMRAVLATVTGSKYHYKEKKLGISAQQIKEKQVKLIINYEDSNQSRKKESIIQLSDEDINKLERILAKREKTNKKKKIKKT